VKRSYPSSLLSCLTCYADHRLRDLASINTVPTLSTLIPAPHYTLINFRRLVRRSPALSFSLYGRSFRYDEDLVNQLFNSGQVLTARLRHKARRSNVVGVMNSSGISDWREVPLLPRTNLALLGCLAGHAGHKVRKPLIESALQGVYQICRSIAVLSPTLLKLE
jgi:hypothetical protein